MDITQIWETLASNEGGKILYLILDGIGGIQDPKTGLTELQSAKKRNLDALAKQSSCGLLEIIGPGITPGSGPGHLSLFGYNPLQYNIGRGVFSALGINFPLKKGDVAARFNFCTVNENGMITDRRAGRPTTQLNESLCDRLRTAIPNSDIECFIETESEHRGVIIFRGEGLNANLTETDPGLNNHPPLEPHALYPEAEKLVHFLKQFLANAKEVLKDQKQANMLLLRGFEKYHPIRGLEERFLLKSLCIAEYPMYKGVSRFLKMDVVDSTGGIPGIIENVKKHFSGPHSFYFAHVKYPDKAGEDGDFSKKVKVIEEVDRYIPELLSLNPDVFVVTGDHSTPAVMKLHSWHPVPVLLKAKHVRIDTVSSFDEIACLQGSLGQRPALDLMGLSLAHAGRLKKFGA